MTVRGLRHLIHEHRPCSTDPGRCAVCLRSLDCAPHLPLAPSPKWIDAIPADHRSTPIGIQLQILDRYAEIRRARAAVQGGR